MRVIAIAAAALAAAACATPAWAECTLKVIAELPVTMVGGSPTVKATLDGNELTFLIDSGAFNSMLAPSAMEALGEKTRAEVRAVGVGGGFAIGQTRVAETLLGAARVRDSWYVVLADGSESFLAGRADGLIGQNILGAQDIEYDLGAGVVRLIQSKDCQGRALAYWTQAGFGELNIRPITQRSPHLQADVKINGQTVTATFDTGAGASVISERAASRAGVRRTSDGVLRGEALSGFGERRRETWLAPFEIIEIGGEQVRNTQVRIGQIDVQDEMLIGADFFLSHRIYVSPGRRKLYFTYSGGPVFKLEGGGSADMTPYPSLDDPEALARRAAVSLARRDLAHAVADYDAAIALAPDVPAYRYARARLHLDGESPEPALADLDAALRVDPDHMEARLLRALIRSKTGDARGSDEDIAHVEASNTDDPDVIRALSRAFAAMDRYDEALRWLNQWLERYARSPNAVETLNERCWVRAILGRELDGALADCDAAIRRGGRIASFLDSRGLVLVRLGRFEDAIRDYDAALDAQPDQAWPLYGRGLAKTRMGRAAEGDADIEAARAIDPEVEQTAQRRGIGS